MLNNYVNSDKLCGFFYINELSMCYKSSAQYSLQWLIDDVEEEHPASCATNPKDLLLEDQAA